jgi:CDP-diacylglycerol--glycerol-3-phosphate 3-phosphatidyltransferase
MIDGYIARTKKQKTVIGSFLDPLADKLLITISLVCLSMQNIPQDYRIPIWVLIAVISRDIILVAGSTLLVVTKHHIEIVPSKLGKFTTLFQMLTIVTVLLHIPRAYLNWIWGAAVVLTVASGLQYLQRGSILLNEPRSSA